MKKKLFLLCLGFILIFNITAVAQEKKSYYSIIYGILKDKENENGISEIKTLLDTGRLNATDDYYGSSKMTPLMLAIKYGHDDLAKVLIAAGADVNAKDSDGNTALIRATQEERYYFHYRSDEEYATKSLSIINALIAAKSDVNAKNNYSNTALMEAAENGDINIVKSLIDAGADVNIKDSDGKIALNIATERGYNNIASMLLEAGTDAPF